MGLLRLAAPLRGFAADGALRGVRAAAVVAAKKETGNARSYDASQGATRAASRREHARPARHDQRGEGDTRTCEVPVSRDQPVDKRYLQRVAHRVVQRRGRRT